MSNDFNIPDQQSAWVNVARGVPSVALSNKKDWPVDKKLAQGELLIKVHAAALNPVYASLPISRSCHLKTLL